MSDESRAEQIAKKPDPTGASIKRRGLLTAAWAAMVGLVAARATKPVQAASGGGADGNLVLGSNFLNNINTASNLTLLGTSSANFGFDAVFDVDAAVNGGSTANIGGMYGHGKGMGYGAMGVAGGGTGTQVSRATLNAGVAGINVGNVANGMGVYGEIPASSSINGIAIYALNYSTYAGPGPGAGGFGIYGLSAKGHGLVGATASAGGAAVVGATNGVAGAYAGAFYGPVIIGGDLTVVGGAKSAAVPHPDGSHRRLYCVESPESWFEDFGSGQLDCGKAEVTIDPDFVAAARTDEYHVFVTEYDQHSDLFVTERTPTGFRVQSKDETSRAAFSWRVVAKRKDIAGVRFEKVTIPSEPELPGVPMGETSDRVADPAVAPRRPGRR